MVNSEYRNLRRLKMKRSWNISDFIKKKPVQGRKLFSAHWDGVVGEVDCLGQLGLDSEAVSLVGYWHDGAVIWRSADTVQLLQINIQHLLTRVNAQIEACNWRFEDQTLKYLILQLWIHQSNLWWETWFQVQCIHWQSWWPAPSSASADMTWWRPGARAEASSPVSEITIIVSSQMSTDIDKQRSAHIAQGS